MSVTGQTIADALSRDLSQNIEEVIKVEQSDETAVFTEITDYVATDRIRQHYRTLLRAVAEYPSDPHEGVGVWVSGFFGAGKSSFAKNLAYALQNPVVQGAQAADLFKKQIEDPQVSDLLDSIQARLPFDAILFDVRVQSKVLQGAGHITELMYTALLRELGYATDYDIAELEIELEGEDKLDEFTSRCQTLYGQEWRVVRKGGQKVPRASAIMNAVDPGTYTTPESWARTMQGRKTDITVNEFVDRAFELVSRRRPGRAVVFVLDEVGAYVARSADKIEDLRAVVERFGQVGRNRVKSGKAKSPIWVVVTSQERLDEVVAAIDSRRVDLPRLQERFKFPVDLAPSDIREVATKRVLAKRDDAVPALRALYRENQGQMNAALRLERTSRKCAITEDEFVQFYPYPPQFIDLSIDVMSGIRLQPGAQTQVGGSNRTIIKQAYEILVSERTALGRKPLGTLVTLDLVYELVEGQLRNEKQLDIASIRQQFEGHPDDPGGWTQRVAKCLCLLEFVTNLPRTEANIAACLVDAVGLPAPLGEVQQAIARLEAAQFVRNSEQGWKLQTAQEKNWETEKRGYLSPKPRERNEILREVLKELFAEPDLKMYRYLGRKNFKVGLTVDGARVGDEGDIPLSLGVAEEPGALADKVEATAVESRSKGHENDVFWVFALTPEVDGLMNRLYASRQMVAKYDQIRASNRITNDEAASLQGEKTDLLNLQTRLRDQMTAAMEQGVGVFHGLSREAASLGSRLPDILRRQMDHAVPELYPKLEMGARSLKGSEAEDLLKAANLNALPAVFGSGSGGLGLIAEDANGRYVPNLGAEIAKEVLDYIKKEHSYGTKVTGKTLDDRFTGLGYGWDRAVIQVVLALLLRASAIEVIHQGRRFRSHTDPQAREPFTNQTAFKSASFAPRASVDLQTLTAAVDYLEQLTGEEVEIDEAAIAQAFQKLADDERQAVLPLIATAQANRLPIADELTDYRQTLDGILADQSDDCVRTLAGEGKTFGETRDRVRRISGALGASGLAAWGAAETAATRMWPALKQRLGAGAPTGLGGRAEELSRILESETFYDSMGELATNTGPIVAAYYAEYLKLHTQRSQEYGLAAERVKGTEGWLLLDQAAEEAGRIGGPDAEATAHDESHRLLTPLNSRLCHQLQIPEGGTECQHCRATLAQMESDLAACAGLTASVIAAVRERAAPESEDNSENDPGTDRVRLADFFGAGTERSATLSGRQAVDDALEQLRAYLYGRLDEGLQVIVE